MTHKQTKVTIIGEYEEKTRVERPLFLTPVKAGFPSPAEDFVDTALDLNELLISHPAATYFVRVEGDSMIDAGIAPGNLLVVDRSVEAQHGDIVIATVDGELTVKRLNVRGGITTLKSENSTTEYAIDPEEELTIWGVVTSVINQVKK